MTFDEVHDHQDLIAEGIHTQRRTRLRGRSARIKRRQGAGMVGRMWLLVGQQRNGTFCMATHAGGAGGGREAEGFWFIMHTGMLGKGRARGGGRQGGKKKRKKKEKGTLHASRIPSFPIHRVPRPLKIIIFQGLSLCQSLPHGEHVQGERAVDKQRGGGSYMAPTCTWGLTGISTRQERGGDTHTVSQV